MGAPEGDRGEPGVSTLELFFDLVFVFTITELTTVLAHRPTGEGLLQVALMLSLIWWMYAGYSWLTNAVTPDRAEVRFALLGGMACWLVISLTIPGAFSGDGEVFAAAYIVVVLIHAALFAQAGGSVVTGVLRLARFNLTAGILVLIASIIDDEPVTYILWGLAVAVVWSTPRMGGSFRIRPGHFVERHGLVVIIALGESVVAVGIGASSQPITVEMLAVAVLGLALSACLWWTYFGEDTDAPAGALEAVPHERRVTVALNSYYYAHLLILIGIVALAAALERAIGHAYDPLSFARALSLGAGVAAFFCGDYLFRASLTLPHSSWRVAAAALALASIPLGTEVSALAQLAALVAALFGCLLAEGSAPESAAA